MAEETNASSYPAAVLADVPSCSLLVRKSGLWMNLSAQLLGQARQQHLTANATLDAADTGQMVTNLGAAGNVQVTLPPATVGLRFDFMVRVASQLNIRANGTEVMESTALPPVATTSGKVLRSSAIGSSISLVCIEAGKWAVQTSRGTWTVA